YVYCVDERDGQIKWKFSAEEAVDQPPVAINGNVYVVPRNERIICLDGETGRVKWQGPGVNQFVGVGASRVYGCNRVGQLIILGLKNGSRLDVMPLPIGTKKLINYQTDRIYLTTDTGTIQCLHEVDRAKPLLYEAPKAATLEERKATVER